MASGGQRWGEVLASIRDFRSERPLERRWWDAQEELLVGLIRRRETEGETVEEILDQALEGLLRSTPLAREVRMLEEADIWPVPSRRVQRPTLEQYLSGTLPPSRPQERELPLPPDPRTPRNRMDLLRDLAQGRQPYRVLKKEVPPQEAERIQACLHLLLKLVEERQ